MKKDHFSQLKKEIIEIIDRNPFIAEDNAFVVWFLRAFIVDYEETAIQSLKGGSRDKGVDALYIDHDTRTVYLIQGKYHQGSKIPSEKRSDVIALADLGRALLSDTTQMFKALLKDADITVQQALEQARSVIRRRGYRLILQFVTTGKVSPIHFSECEQRIEDWETASYEAFSRIDLLRLMQDYIEGAAPPVPTVLLPIQGSEVFKRFDEKTKITSWIFSIAGSDISKIYKEVGIRLFARNIRGYLGNKNINRGILNTIQDEPEYFWYYNNGITVVCDEARQISKRGSNQLRVSNAQIINGQQTTRTLALENSSDAKVLLKLIEIPRDSTDSHNRYGHLVTEIVSATNWQNAISQSDLKSNDIEQIRIEREFRKLNYQYLRKKMSKAEARKINSGRYGWIIKKEELARSVGSCVLDPYQIRLGRDRLFEDDVYPQIFFECTAIEYLTFYWLNRKVSYWSRVDSRRGYARSLVVNFVYSKLKSRLFLPSFREKFRRAAERSKQYGWELQPLDRISEFVFKNVMAYYRANKRKDGKIFDESNFFKHANLHIEYQKYWSKQPVKKIEYLNKQIHLFFERIVTVE